MVVVFLRNDIGIPSESFFAKMERVLASLRVQSYNAKRGFQIFRKFVLFRNVKISSLPQCLRGKIYFFVLRKCTIFKMSFDAKMTPLAKLTIDAQNRQNNKKNTRLTNLIFQS